MTPSILINGHHISVRQDRFPDGRGCWVAEDLDVDGCVAYSERQEEAIARMVALRALLDPRYPAFQVFWPTLGAPTSTVVHAPAGTVSIAQKRMELVAA